MKDLRFGAFCIESLGGSPADFDGLFTGENHEPADATYSEPPKVT